MKRQDYEIIFFCPECDAELQAKADLCGEKMACLFCGKEISVPIPGLEKGLEIGEFVLIRKLGSGGMGEVWLADQQSMQRQVALKILHPHLADDESFVNRFMNETRNVGKLQHPNIITAYTAGGVGDYYYLATSYVDGVELVDKLKIDGVFPEREALHIIRDIARALKYAWEEHRMLHRDVKPGNIMLDKNETPRLMDMGIATIVADNQQLQTRDHMVVGTPDYISPEQARNLSDMDFRSDVYSLGATLYHLVVGTLPFEADTFKELLKMHVLSPLPDPQKQNRRISPQCAALIKIMMAKDRKDRQSSWSYVIADIEAVLAGRIPTGVGKMRQFDQKHPPGEIKYSTPDAPVHLPINKTRKRCSTTVGVPFTTVPDTGVTLRLSEQESLRPVSAQPTPDSRPSSQPGQESRELQLHSDPVLPRRVFDANKKRRRWIGYVIVILLLLLLLGMVIL